MPDEPRHDAPDTGRATATAYPLTLEDVSRFFDEAGLPHKVRTLQRCSAAGRLAYIKLRLRARIYLDCPPRRRLQARAVGAGGGGLGEVAERERVRANSAV
jgi:hypothetical protein